MEIAWGQRYACRVKRMQGSAIRELLKVTELPGTISFAGGLPAAEIFPVAEIEEVIHHILEQDGRRALQYGTTEGYMPLRELLAQRLRQAGVPVSRENICTTTGSQQGLDLLGKLLIDPANRVLVEAPTYLGALQAWTSYEPEYRTVRSDEEGMVTAEVAAALQEEATFLYVQPNFQNPSGVTLTEARREQLVAAAGDYGLPIIEDDPYSQLRFEGDALPSLLMLESARQQRAKDHAVYEGNVIQLNTFSKVLTPGLRVGWVVAPSEVISKLVLAKQGTDLHTATLNQMIAYELTRAGFLEKHIPLIRQTYRQRRDTMLAALATYAPDSVHWTHPQGGMFLWVTLPKGVDTTTLLAEALDYSVAFVPGAAFHPCGGGENTMRLSFSTASPELIEEGIKRLGRLLHARLKHL